QAKLAGERGARAILFDITDDESAADQLRKPRGLSQPVVLIRGHDAELLMGVVNKNREAHVKIEVKEPPAWPDYDVWILLTVVSTVVVIILIFVVRTKCQLNRTQVGTSKLLCLSNWKGRKGRNGQCRPAARWDSASTCSSAPVCAICLEEFSEGQELRIISCSHEFHRECVDPWLQQHHTCPLCMFNILARDSVDQATAAGSRIAPRDMEPGRRLHLFRQHPGHALYHLPHAYPQRNLRNFPPEPAHGNPFFHSLELSQPQPQPPCLGLKAALVQKQHRAPALRRGVGHGHQHNSSGSGESYLTEHSGYLADGPGSDSSSGPCHGSSSDSMLNCTDVSLQGINGRRSLDLMVPGGAGPAKPQVLSYVHYHHHQHHHYRRDAECPPGWAGQGPGQRKSRYSGAKPPESSTVLQEAALAGQPDCSQQGREPPLIPSASPSRLDFSIDASRQSGASGTSPVPLPPKHSSQSRHHRRKRKCPLEPDPALLPEDSALPKACDAHDPHGHPAGYRCSPEAQPLIPPSAPLSCSSGSRPLWKCLVP
ncbi:E3 ubiquitin-protein ligase RNF43, partial [Nestor notabilis]